jgi:hypothetical protein
VPPTSCQSRPHVRTQSWAPPLPNASRETPRTLPSSYAPSSVHHYKRESPRDIVRPLPSSRVTSVERQSSRDILRPLPSSRVTSLDRVTGISKDHYLSPLTPRETSKDIPRSLPSRVSPLAPPPDRQVRNAPMPQEDIVFKSRLLQDAFGKSPRLPSPPRRMVSRQLVQTS